MIVTVLLSFFVAGILGAPGENRIIGGELAKPGDAPWLVSVQRYAAHICGGSILSKNVVLTAAHCVHGFEDKPKMHGIRWGILDLNQPGNFIMAIEIKKHQGYQSIVSHPNDIALLKLSKDIPMNNPNLARPVILATTPPPGDMKAFLAGWGMTESGSNSKELLKVDLTLYNDKTCSQYMKPNGFDPKMHFCAGDLAGGHGQCQGDSGGPLTIDGVQYGIVSFSMKPCASPKKPGVFTRVPAYLDWIQKNSI